MDSPGSGSSSASIVEDDLALPEYAQNPLPELELHTLVLISHGHSPPLKPAPELKFDVRPLPNPPKHTRDAHNGTSKRLQEWMRTDPKFLARQNAIKEEIEAAMTCITTTRGKRDILRLGSQHGRNTGHSDAHPPEAGQQGEGENAETLKSDEKESSEEDDDTSSREKTDTLRVSIFCELGRHRSVAIVEGLAKISWSGWCVEIEHRDISKKRGAGKKSGGKGSRRIRG
jgi:RNase adaptor protein for sRNA GlmZ degradation